MARYYLAFGKPNEGPFSAYVRYQFFHKIGGTYRVELFLTTDQGVKQNGKLTSYPDVQLIVDRATIGDWQVAPGLYVWDLDTRQFSEGSHALYAQARWPGSGHEVLTLGVPVIVDNDGKPVAGKQQIWQTPLKFDLHYTHMLSDMPDAVTYPGQPVARDEFVIPHRQADPMPGQILPADQLWVERIPNSIAQGSAIRLFNQRRSGDISITPVQYYFYTHTDQQNLPMLDGAHNSATLPALVSGRVSPEGTGVYWIASTGRLGFTSTTGRTITLGGWKLKESENQPQWQEYTAVEGAQRDWWMSKLDLVGDWKDDPKGFKEPWDVAMLHVHDDPSYETGYHRGLITDTLHHRLVYWDHVHTPTPHSEFSTFTQFPIDAEPWGIDSHDEHFPFYVTDYARGAIYEVHEDGNYIEVAKSAQHFTDAQIGVKLRRDVSGFTPSYLRTNLSKDGAFGEANIIRPQICRLDSTGTKLVFVERYTFAVRMADLVAKTIKTINVLPREGWYQNMFDINMDLDKWGNAGPKDAIYVTGWYQETDWAFKIDGTYLGNWYNRKTADGRGYPLVRGPLNRASVLVYPWMSAVGRDGSKWIASGGAQLMRITKKKPTDPNVDLAKYIRGMDIYKRGGIGSPKRPSFVLQHGNTGQDLLGGMTFDDMARMSDADLGAYIQSGMGSDIARPEIIGTHLSDLIYYIRWNAYTVPDGTEPPPVTLPSPPSNLTVNLEVRA